MPAPPHLTAPEDFRLVYREGTRISDDLLTIYVRPTASSVPNVGIAVPRRVGTAVRRNRLKRRVREAVQRCAEALPQGADVVIVPRPAAATVPFAAVQESVRALFNRGAVSVRRGGGLSRPT